MMISSLINKGKRNKNWQNCVHRSEFIFETPSDEYIQKINKIIDRTNFK